MSLRSVGDVRIAFYNVRGLRHGDDQVADVVARLGADVLAVAEPARGPTGRRRMRRVVASAGLVPVVSGGSARTTALFARAGLVVTGARGVRLPGRPGLTRRGFAVADVAGVQVLAVHLGLRSVQRRDHVARILCAVRPAGPVVLAGDLNEEPGGGVWRLLTTRLADLTALAGPTYPARAPRLRIDVVLGSGVGVVGGPQVPDDRGARCASDHRPVVVDVMVVGDVTAAGAGERSAG